jgi:hypothetical protein
MERIRNQAIAKDEINMLYRRTNPITCQVITKDEASRNKSLQEPADNRLITSFGHAIAKTPQHWHQG